MKGESLSETSNEDGKSRRAVGGPNGLQTRTESQENFVVFLLGFARNHPLCAALLQPNSDLYCQRLDRLKKETAQKRSALANRRRLSDHIYYGGSLEALLRSGPHIK